MLRNYLTVTLGNLYRNGFYAAIAVGSLAIGFAAVILMGLYLRDEYSFDRFIPRYQDVYRVELSLVLPAQQPLHRDLVQSTTARHLKLDFPEIADVARLSPASGLLNVDGNVVSDTISWADPDFFRVLPMAVLSGDPNAAMHSPDGLVLTRAMARKYFGQDAPLGSTILIDPELPGSLYHPMKVMAVLKDTPTNSHLTAEIFASALAPFSPTSADELHPSPYNRDQLTYVRLKPGASPDRWDARWRIFDQAHYPAPGDAPSPFRFSLASLSSLHFAAAGTTMVTRPPGDRRVDAGIAAIGALIMLIATINFVTLVTARATRRAVEVGIRKAVGARRRDLVLQFMGEALIYVAIAMMFAVVFAELLLPSLNTFVGRELKFRYLTDPTLDAALLAGAAVTAVFAGFYPALVLSAFRPATALKAGSSQVSGSPGVRRALVVVQFAILIGLILMTATIYRQTQFALKNGLRMDADQVLLAPTPCNSSLRQAAQSVAGVRAVACASGEVFAANPRNTVAVMSDYSLRTIAAAQVDVGFFELHGLHPVAGRFFSRDYGEDILLDRFNPVADLQPSIVLNEAGARRLGYANPAGAVGDVVDWARFSAGTPPSTFPAPHPSRVIGIVPDFTLGSIRSVIPPMIFYVDPAMMPVLSLKLDRNRIPEAVQGLEKLWRATAPEKGLRRPDFVFENQSVESLYKDVIIQEIAIGNCSGLAILIACFGLFALAAYTTERRIKEIGVRKAMGASSGDVVRLLLWQFTQPVLWANLVAWPAAFFAMNWWLHGFAYRVGQPVWLFLAASIAVALIAWITVSFQSWMAAHAKPATALRYE